MDTSLTLTEQVRHEIEAYVGSLYKGRMFAISDVERQTYKVIKLPDNDAPVNMRANVVVLARVIDDTVSIERDITDRPLYDSLIHAGIPREHIVLAYAGEAPTR
jgi:uncharacterized protein (UPF0218 family)